MASGGIASESSGGIAVVVPPIDPGPTGGTRSTASDAGGGGLPPGFECNLPREKDWGGGFVLCGNGSSRRPEAKACQVTGQRPVAAETCHAGDECCLDSDCAAAPYGYCSYGACIYGCVSDADCAADSLCLCEEPFGRCILTLCHSDLECPPGIPCFSPSGSSGFFCPSPSGRCFSHLECAPRAMCQPQDPDGGGVCVQLPG